MSTKKRITASRPIPEIEEALQQLPKESHIFVDHAYEISKYIQYTLSNVPMSQKELANKLNKTEAEISKWLSGMHNFTLRTISKLESALPLYIINPAIKFYWENRLFSNKKIQAPIVTAGIAENMTIDSVQPSINIFIFGKPDNINTSLSLNHKSSYVELIQELKN
jgi:transcriptional regulator with XRE-family HTH domain